MTEKEKRENEALKNCIQEAYGLSDEQLLAELEELEATLSDDEFVGAEERIYNKIKEREAERVSDSSEETTTTSETSTSNSNQTPIRKISKKKRWLVIGIAAALVVGAGVNTIGGNHYFLRQYVEEEGIVLDSGRNIVETGDLNQAYLDAEKLVDFPILRMNYTPQNMVFVKLSIINECVTFTFKINDNYVYFIQEKRDENRSIGLESDRNKKELFLENEWIKGEIVYEDNLLETGELESSILISGESASYKIIGKITKDEMEKIAKKLSY